MGGMLSFQCKFLAALRIGIMYAYPARLRASRARAAQNRRTVADGTVEWAAVPVSQLVGSGASGAQIAEELLRSGAASISRSASIVVYRASIGTAISSGGSALWAWIRHQWRSAAPIDCCP